MIGRISRLAQRLASQLPQNRPIRLLLISGAVGNVAASAYATLAIYQNTQAIERITQNVRQIRQSMKEDS